MVEMAKFNVLRAITTKVGKSELQFMCSAHRLIVLNFLQFSIKTYVVGTH